MSDHLLNHSAASKKATPNLFGLVPAAGNAYRISPLPLSKEIFPIGFYQSENNGRLQPKPVCLNLLESMRIAGTSKAYIVLRKGKWDIPNYLGDGKQLKLNLGYLIMDLPYGVPFTLDQAFPFIQDATVVFGFPDIIFQPENAFVKLLDRQVEYGADLVLGLFPANNPQKADMVVLNSRGKIDRIEIKPGQTALKFTWVIAVWKPSFTRFLHDFIQPLRQSRQTNKDDPQQPTPKEVFMSEVVQSALDSELTVDQVIFTCGSYIDIGTPEGMLRASTMPAPH